MPFPWKKTKVTRISRIVADLQSPKRGGSLVVETGFPTSLIDLFVKNRDRLKKPSLKKKKKKKKTTTNEENDTNHLDNDNNINDPLAHDPIPSNSDSGLDDSSICVEPSYEEVEISAPTESVEEEEEEGEDEAAAKVESETHEDQSRFVVFLSVLKIFAVVVLALSTKKLTVGITLSAFVLLFLEFVGKRLILRLLKKEKEGKLLVDEKLNESRSPTLIEEIEVVEVNIGHHSNNNNNNGEEIFSGGPDLEFLSRDKKWGFLDRKEVMEDRPGETLVVEKSKSTSKRAKMKAKIIKKFVPKKLRSSKRVKKCNQDDEKVEKLEEEQELEEEQGSEEEEEEEEKRVRLDVGNELSVGCKEKEQEQEQEQAQKGRVNEERKGNWVYLSPFLIVLVGLFGGRILALLLTISWCFVLKLTGRQLRSSLAEIQVD